MAEGTQSFDRAVGLLDIVSRNNRDGVAFADLLAATQLTRPTARRLLMALAEHGFVEQDAASKRYFLGPKVYELALLVLPSFDFREIYQPSLNRLVEDTGDTVFLNRVVSDDIVCIARESGSFPVKAFILDVGVQRPIGIGAGGIAVLSEMEAEEAAALLGRNAERIAALGGDTSVAARLMEEARKRGYVARDVSGLGTRTIAMALHDSTGKPFASLSVSTIRDRMQGDHLECVVAALGEEVATIREKMSRLRPQHTG
ncbi:IclR family transcriptional regulator [Stappia sp.]|uniref:IclR family transcriptional regulator n=1 Tax=Stappia sp. TaxID=1870903 RepID=UPI003C79A136